MYEMTTKTTLTQKGEIVLRIIPLKATHDNPIMVEARELNKDNFYESIFTDSLEVPEKRFLGNHKHCFFYEEATYVLVCKPLELTLFVSPDDMPEIETGNTELDRVANSYKPLFQKKRFAKECSEIAQQLQIPYTAALSLKGSKSECTRFRQSVETAIVKGYFKSPKNMSRIQNAICEQNEAEANAMLNGMRIVGETKTPVRLLEAVLEMFNTVTSAETVKA